MARESLAVLAAILIAFSLDAWWDERREAARVLDALDAVAAEMQFNIELLSEAIEVNAQSVANSEEVLRLTVEDLEQAGPDEVGSWMSFPNYEEVRLQLGAITAFIEGGFLAELPERNLRSRLASIPRLQEEIDEEAAGVSGIQWRLTENFMTLVPVDRVLAASENRHELNMLFLQAIVSDETSRQFILNRNFSLGQLYNNELRLTREQIQAILAELEGWRSGGD